jgi:predicted oxidoreductase (fatty acid repression mutant protein)
MTDRPKCENCDIPMRFVLADIHGEKFRGWYCQECGLFKPIDSDKEVEIKFDKENVLKAITTTALFIDDEMVVKDLTEQLEL